MKNSNIITLVIGFMIGLLVMYLILPADESKKEESTEESLELSPDESSDVTPEDKSELTEESSAQKALPDTNAQPLPSKARVPVGLGRRIPKSEILLRKQEFVSIRQQLKPELEKLNVEISSAYSFGLSEVRSLISDIDMINNLNGWMGTDNELTGIQIQMGRSSRMNSGTGKESYYIDLIIAPVNLLGEPLFYHSSINYNDIPEETGIVPENQSQKAQGGGGPGGETGLNASNPCPDVC